MHGGKGKQDERVIIQERPDKQSAGVLAYANVLEDVMCVLRPDGVFLISLLITNETFTSTMKIDAFYSLFKSCQNSKLCE